MFLVHLWKEWRDHRMLVLAQMLIVAVGSGLIVWLTGDPDTGGEAQRMLAPAVLLLASVTTLLLGGDLVAGELRRGKHRLLSRLPDAVPRAFLAKVVALVLSGVVAAAVGLLSAELVWRSVGTGGLDLWTSETWLGGSAWILVAFPIVAVWTLAASCWIRQGSLALPGAVIVLGVVLLPFAWIVRWHPDIRPLPFDLVAVPAVIGVAGLVAAYRSFTRGLRFGGGGASAIAVLPLALLLCVPAWGLGYRRLVQWTTVRPEAQSFQIGEVLLGEGGRFAFVEARNSSDHWTKPPYRTLAVNLRDGSWRDTGVSWEDGDALMTPAFAAPDCQYRTVAIGGAGGPRLFLDGRTGRDGARLSTSADRQAGQGRLRELARETSSLTFDGGRKAWFHRGVLEVSGDDGQVEPVPWNPLDRPLHPCGDGFLFRPANKSSGSPRYFDLNLMTQVEPDWPWWECSVLIRKDRWIVSRRSGDSAPVLWNPLRRTFEEAPFLEKNDRVIAVLGSGDLVVGAPVGDGGKERLTLVSPHTAVRTRLLFEDLSPAETLRLPLGRSAWTTPEEDPVLVLDSEEGQGYGRLDRSGGRIDRLLIRMSVYDRFVACIDKETALIVTDDGHALARARFSSDEVEILFPR